MDRCLFLLKRNKPITINQVAISQAEMLKLKENPVPPMLGVLYIGESKHRNPKYKIYCRFVFSMKLYECGLVYDINIFDSVISIKY